MKNHTLVIAAALCAPAFLSATAFAAVFTKAEEQIPIWTSLAIAVDPLVATTLFSLQGTHSGLEPRAPDSPISTDRPGLLFSPTLVPEGRFQVEASLPAFTQVRGGGNDLEAWSFPVALRYGLSDRVELRASLPTWTDLRIESGGVVTRDDGFSDAEIGAKFRLNDTQDPPLALLTSLRLPTGEDGFTTDEFGGSVYLMLGRNLGDGFGLTLLGGVIHTPVKDSSDTTAGALGALVIYAIAPRWSMCGEVAAYPGINNVTGQAFAGGGVVWAVTDDVQLDLWSDFGLDEDSADVLATFGISWRF
jgi:hypothetical protein